MNHNDKWVSGRMGFTLIELLVVISIVGILATMLLPGLRAAKKQAQGIQCLSNLKQFSLAWHLCAGDYDENIPPNHPNYGWPNIYVYSWVLGRLNCSMDDIPDNTNTVYLTESLIAPYLAKSIGVWRCPGDKSTSIHSGKSYPRVRSYVMNFHVNSEFKSHDEAYVVLSRNRAVENGERDRHGCNHRRLADDFRCMDT